MDTLHPALERLREYRATMDPTTTIDPVSGLKGEDLDAILTWAGSIEQHDAPTLASVSPPALRIVGRVAVVVVIVLICVLIYVYSGT